MTSHNASRATVNSAFVTDSLSNVAATGTIYTTTFKGDRNVNNQIVSDMSGQDSTAAPFTSWLFTIVTALGLITCLAVSFIRYHWKLKAKREKDLDYVKHFMMVRPESELFELKISRARSVMTNTHVENLYEAYVLAAQQTASKRRHSFPSKARDTDDHVTYDEINADASRRYKGGECYDTKYGYGKAKSTGALATEVYMEYDLKQNINDTDNYLKHYTEQSTEPSPRSKRSPFKKKSNKGKGKKSNRFLKQASLPDDPKYGNSDIHKFKSVNLDITKNADDTVPSVVFRRPQSVPNTMYAFENEVFDSRPTSNKVTRSALNDYYADCGLPVPRSLREKSSTSLKSSTSDGSKDSKSSLFPKSNSKADFQELRHRNSSGDIITNARSLPVLEHAFHENIAKQRTYHDNFELKPKQPKHIQNIDNDNFLEIEKENGSQKSFKMRRQSFPFPSRDHPDERQTGSNSPLESHPMMTHSPHVIIDNQSFLDTTVVVSEDAFSSDEDVL